MTNKKHKKNYGLIIVVTALVLADILIMIFPIICFFSKNVRVYERFADNYTDDKFAVSCDWDKIDPLLSEQEFEKYGLYTDFPYVYDSFRDCEKELNAIEVYNTPRNNRLPNVNVLGVAKISYGAINCGSIKDSKNTQYFTEPMIEIHHYGPKKLLDVGPNEWHGYRAVYSLDGELALEEGEWNLDADKDEFCMHYFNLMLKLIGKQK